MGREMESDLVEEHYTFECIGRDVTVSRDVVRRLCEEGHIFRSLLFGGGGFQWKTPVQGGRVALLKNYGIRPHVFGALVLALRTGEARVVYKYRFIVESIGGFAFLDTYVKERRGLRQPPPPQSNDRSAGGRMIIDLRSDDEDEDDGEESVA